MQRKSAKCLLVIVIVVGVLSWMTWAIFGFEGDPKLLVTRSRFLSMGWLLQDHRLRYGNYPVGDSWTNLAERAEMGQVDLWGEKYVITIELKRFELRSCGPDKECHNADDLVLSHTTMMDPEKRKAWLNAWPKPTPQED